MINSNPTDCKEEIEEEPEELQVDYENERYLNGLSSADSYFVNSGVNSTLNCVKQGLMTTVSGTPMKEQ